MYNFQFQYFQSNFSIVPLLYLGIIINFNFQFYFIKNIFYKTNKMGKQQKIQKQVKKAQDVGKGSLKNQDSKDIKNKQTNKQAADQNQNNQPHVKKNALNNKSVQNDSNNQNNPSKANRKSEVDERFAKASYDPKFLRPKKQMTKVKVDSRFTKMLTDPAFQSLNKVDKYGRKIQQNGGKNKKQNEQLKEFYTYEKQDIEDENDEQQNDEEIESQSGYDQQMGDNQMQQQQGSEYEGQLGQGQQNLREWMQNYDQESSSLADMPIDQLVQEQNEGPQVWSDDENVVKNQKVKATKRLALCNFDWMNIASKDLMILFNSFKPATGFIKSIKVYQSLLGKQKMQEQEMFGPQGIWNQRQDLDFQQEEQNKAKKKRKSWKELLNKQDSSALDSRKLRAYEKERLKYFYAVIECDSKKTADQIYKQCDGNHFQNSNLQFDLRFIPDEIQFDGNMLKEECNEMPISGEVKNFVNRAMGHSKVELTWQDPQLTIQAGLKKKNWGKMSEQQLNKIDWATYLNEGEIEQDENRQQLFLQQNENQGVPDWKRQCDKKFRKQNAQQQLVISFDSGFNSYKKVDPQAHSLKKQKKSKKQLRARAQEERKKKREDLVLMTEHQDQDKQKNFKANVKDQRFTAVYSNPLFSIDPSNPKFDHKKTGNVFKEVVQRNKGKNLS